MYVMRIYLRAFELSDSSLIHRWRSNEDIVRNVSGNTYFVSSEREKKWVEDKIVNDYRDMYLAICLKANNEMIGYTSINNIDYRNRKAEWGGTIIGEIEHQSQGYATEAAILMLGYIFEELNLNKCYGYCLEEHAATIKLLKKLHFTQEGILRENVFKNNSYKNMLLFSLLRHEYEAVRSQLSMLFP